MSCAVGTLASFGSPIPRHFSMCEQFFCGSRVPGFAGEKPWFEPPSEAETKRSQTRVALDRSPISHLDDGDFGEGSEEEFISRRTDPKRVSTALLLIAGQYRHWFTDLYTASSQHIVLGRGQFVS